MDFRCVYGGSTNAPSCEGCDPARPITIVHFDNTGDYEAGATVTACVQQGESHCGNYDSLGIVDKAWEIMSQTSLP